MYGVHRIFILSLQFFTLVLGLTKFVTLGFQLFIKLLQHVTHGVQCLQVCPTNIKLPIIVNWKLTAPGKKRSLRTAGPCENRSKPGETAYNTAETK